MESKISNITGVILAGGKSTRMQKDKALLELNGKPFIRLISETLSEIFSEIIIVSNSGNKYGFLNLPVTEDIYKNCGPLGGIHSGLTYTKNDIFVVACDLPLIDKELINSILHVTCKGEVTVFSINQIIQPLFGFFGISCLEKIRHDLESNKLSVQRFIQNCNSNVVPAEKILPTTRLSLLSNINTFSQYKSII